MDPTEDLTEFFPEIIRMMKERFSLHEFVIELGAQHPHAYVKALAQYVDAELSPFNVVHSRIARMLKSDQFKDYVGYVGQIPSKDLFGRDSSVALFYRKK